MKIGYPCLNLSINDGGNKTFRLRSYSESRLIETVENNLSYLSDMLLFNTEHRLLFFRASSDLVPFASHPVCQFDWESHFRQRFRAIGDFIRKHNIRISMHPDQFTLINSIDEEVYRRSIAELTYHAEVLDLMELDTSAKLQIHVGGVYGDKRESIARFVRRFGGLDERVRGRLAIENDDRLYNLKDCLQIHAETGVPIIFDVLHHELNNSAETLEAAFRLFSATWNEEDGIPVVDYSSQETGGGRGSHAKTIDTNHFRGFIRETKGFDFDIMLEIKDKETSALKAAEILAEDERLRKGEELRF